MPSPFLKYSSMRLDHHNQLSKELPSNCTTGDSLFTRLQVALGHMSCLVEGNGGEQRVTFLYKLAPGPCPKSFGINVARLAQLPDAVSDFSC